MTITATRGKKVSVAWFVGGSLRRTTFPAAMLKTITPPLDKLEELMQLIQERATPEEAAKAYALMIEGDKS